MTRYHDQHSDTEPIVDDGGMKMHSYSSEATPWELRCAGDEEEDEKGRKKMSRINQTI